MKIIYLAVPSISCWSPVVEPQPALECLELLLNAAGNDVNGISSGGPSYSCFDEYSPAIACALPLWACDRDRILLTLGMMKLLLTYGTNFFEPRSHQNDKFLFSNNVLPI